VDKVGTPAAVAAAPPSGEVTVLSHCDICGIGVNTDTGADADPNVLMDCPQHCFEESSNSEARPARTTP